MTNVSDAQRIILEQARLLDSEPLAMMAAHGRVLAEDVVANEDIPPFDNSSMDGYAVRTAETMQAGSVLSVIGEIAAGSEFLPAIQSRTAVRIMTGAPIPPGADAVVELEAVAVKNGSIVLSGPVAAGRNVRRKGEDIRAGEVAVKAGTRLSAVHLGVLASLGVHRVRVVRKPRVALLTTGNELVEVHEKPKPGQIRNSNAYTLWGLAAEAGGEPVRLGVVRDNVDDLRRALQPGLDAEVLITSGGVSVGAHDYVLTVLKQLGVEIKFWKVNIKPGMPMVFGVYERERGSRRTLVFGLPGNPVSTMVTFLQFVRPALLTMTGQPAFPSIRLKARLLSDVLKRDGKRHFVRGVLRQEGDGLVVETTGTQSSGALSSMARANCFIILPEEARDQKAGVQVHVELWPL